jgi:hypothetical protein
MAATKRRAEAGRPPAESWRKSLFDDLLRGIRLQSSIYFRTEFQAPWGIAVAKDCVRMVGKPEVALFPITVVKRRYRRLRRMGVTSIGEIPVLLL